MMKNLQIFSNKEFGEIRLIEHDGKPYAVGLDVAKMLEYAKPSQAVIDHCKGIRKLGIPSAGGIQETNCIPEGDIYRLIVKAADQSKNPLIKEKADKIERWIFDEILPSISHHGMYAIDELIENPDLLIEVATQLKQERQQRKALESKVQQDAPKVLFADAVAASHAPMLIGELAKILKQNGVDTGEKRLFQWLRENGYLIKRFGTDFNAPTQRAMELGLFEVKETAITHSDGHVTINRTTKVTGKGQQYFINRFLGKAVEGETA